MELQQLEWNKFADRLQAKCTYFINPILQLQKKLLVVFVVRQHAPFFFKVSSIVFCAQMETIWSFWAVTKERFLPGFSGFRTANPLPSLNWQHHQKIVCQANKASPCTPFIWSNVSVAIKPCKTYYCNKPLLHLRCHGKGFCRHIPIITPFEGCFER